MLGAVHFGLLFHWVPVALVSADPSAVGIAFAGAAYLLIVAGLAALASLFVGLLHEASRGVRAPLWLSLAVTWTALEWTRAHLPDSLALPWLGLGTSLTAYPEAVGMAELVGARGVTFWLVAVNGLLAMGWMRWRGRSVGSRDAVPVPVLVWALVVTALPVAWGFWRAETLTTRPVAEVAVVQPDVDGRTKIRDAEPTLPLDALPAVSSAYAREGPADYALTAAAVDLVVFPELFLRGDPRSPGSAPAVQALGRFAGEAGAPILFGALGRDSGPLPFNSAFLLEADGFADFRYDKRRLVPVVERTPFAFGGAEGDYGVGRGWPLAEVGGVRYGVLVCYESSYPEEARALRQAGADVLVNVTNDAWLGGPDPLTRTVALWQHPAHLVMRAIEGRVGVVRSANTGISLFVDPVGRIHDETELFTRAVTRATVRTTDGPTLYVRAGDVVGGASAAGALALLLLGLGSRRRPPSSLDPSR